MTEAIARLVQAIGSECQSLLGKLAGGGATGGKPKVEPNTRLSAQLRSSIGSAGLSRIFKRYTVGPAATFAALFESDDPAVGEVSGQPGTRRAPRRRDCRLMEPV